MVVRIENPVELGFQLGCGFWLFGLFIVAAFAMAMAAGLGGLIGIGAR